MFHFSLRTLSTRLRTPKRRIILAVAFSALMHAVILWLPYIHLPQKQIHLPPLTVRLKALPKPDILPTAVPERTIQTSMPSNTPSTESRSKPEDSMEEIEQSAVKHLFPKHLQITFDVYKGENAFSIGEIHHQLDIYIDRYTLISVKQTTGLSSLLNNNQLTLTSHGTIGKQGLQPEGFKEEKISDGNKQSLESTFNWATQKLRLSNGSETALPADTQDALSFMYQFSQLPMDREIIPLAISNGEALEQLEIEVGVKEDIVTPMGKVRAWHLRKLHAQDEAYFEIWLGLEYRLLPVKFRLISGSGEVIEELAVSSIRVSDE